MWLSVAGCALGLVAGARHALEPDHVTAVATLVAQRRPSRAALRFALAWGLGHGIVLVALGAALVALRAQIPARAGDVLELAVAATLVALGARGLARSRDEHAPARPGSAGVPVAVGAVHGLAGTGGLAALVASEQPTLALAALTLALYAAGAALGMLSLAALVTLPLAAARLGDRALRGLVVASSVASIVVGLAWSVPIVGRALAQGATAEPEGRALGVLEAR